MIGPAETPKNCKICIKNTVLGNIGRAEHAQACPGCPPLTEEVKFMNK